MFRIIVTCAILLLVFDAPSDCDDVKLSGKWIVTFGEVNGKEFGELKGLKVTIAGNAVVINPGDRSEEKAIIEVVPDSKPAAVNITNKSGGTFASIYRLQGNELVVCMPLSRTDSRPAEFKSSGTTNTALVKLKRSP